jgi:hypothetical protein
VRWEDSSSDPMRGRRLLQGALALTLLAFLAVRAEAQHVVTEPPRVGAPVGVPPMGGSTGIGGGAGLIPTLPQIQSAPAIAAPPAAVPAAPAAPAAPARAVRFRCELQPQQESCREAGAPDGGGDDSECNCTHDYCYTTAAGTRVCEKSQ